ncbi:MAG TPA: M1 family aminopeptidase [bacterium]|nr:M1 family aminopeptidase [bacterium]
MKKTCALILILFFALSCDDAKQTRPDADATDDTAVNDDVLDELLTEDAPDEDTVPFDGDFEQIVVIPKEGIELTATVDITRWQERLFTVIEKLSFPAPADGNTVKLFGEKMSIAQASVPFENDQHTILFFPGEFKAGDPLVIEATFSFEQSSSMGLRVWEDDATDEKVVGPFTEPYFTPYWLIVPQSPFKTDKDNDANVPVEKVKLSVVVPGDEWQVMGPGVTGTREGDVVTFTMDTPMPFYALSFAASPDHTYFSAGKSASGVEVIGAGFAREIENLKQIYPAGVATVDWMEEHLGPYEFGDKVGLVSIPDFGGGMEHVGVIYMGTDVLADYDSGLFVTVHEIVHNWWGDNVRFADWPDFWVAEGFDEWTTNYNLMAVLEDADAFAARRAQYRSVAALLCSSADAVPLKFDADKDFMTLDMQIQTSYYYGAAFLEMVNKRLAGFNGQSLLPLLKLWFEEKHLTTVTTEDFLDFLIAHTSDALNSTTYWNSLFDDWVYSAPCPTLKVSNYTEDCYGFTLTHGGKGPDLFNLSVQFLEEDGSVIVEKSVELKKGESEIVGGYCDGPAPARILIDPEWSYVFSLDTTGWKGPEIGYIDTAPAKRRYPLSPKERY